MPPKKQKTSSPDYPSLARFITEASVNSPDCKPAAGLYIVATPIGNLGDITLRALAVLALADIIACEDTRNSGLLLQAYGIKKTLLSYHDHNEEARQAEILQRLAQGEVVALISDAGMPVIADPGFKLVRACSAAQIPVTVIPGANAAITALAGSGLPSDAFQFCGFLPPKSAARKKQLQNLKSVAATLVFYEAPQRVAESLADMHEVLGKRQAVVTRELTKLYEESRSGNLSELAEHYAQKEIKGEIVILIASPAEDKNDIDIDALLRERLTQLSVRDAVAEIAAMTGVPKKEIYARALVIEQLLSK